ncbi:hypothetical protein [Microscilla marina]|nr:hypothetical protein [Microscilla marina]
MDQLRITNERKRRFLITNYEWINYELAQSDAKKLWSTDSRL